MKLKHYQEKVLTTLNEYLSALSDAKTIYNKVLAIDQALASTVNFPQIAWEKTTGKKTYYSKRNSIGEYLPDIYLKIPTGGGKTFLACHSIDQIQKTYLQKQNGLVLWVVPSTQIYRQTILALKDRNHPYRQLLDISTGGYTLIKEKGEFFSRLDIEENLVILVLMLPSANRKFNEKLKVFRDAGFYDFFPAEDNYNAQKELLEKIPNLDYFGSTSEVFQRQIKTSLGNVLRVVKPIIIIDEGHKAYSEGARNTINDFNPSFVLELSATPPPDSNLLVQIGGRDLHEEEMIKLDIHLVNKSSSHWQDTMLASLERLKNLSEQATAHSANTGQYIRPAMLIQVERTGKDQRVKDYIHAEDVKEYLINQCNIPESEIAIKSSEKDDIEGLDLFAEDCPIKFIITKSALQEGWDFSFAYVLTILTNPGSATSITQLVGRILRQPYAKKTQIKQLDECYIYTFKPNASKLVQEIRAGLNSEGLGDIAGRVVGDDKLTGGLKETEANYRPGFKHFEGKIFLPHFVLQEENSWRDLNFEADILRQIDFEALDLSGLDRISLNADQTLGEVDLAIGYPEENLGEIITLGQVLNKGTLKINEALLAQQIGILIPNPWIAYMKGEEALQRIRAKFIGHKNPYIIESNFVFITQEIKKIIQQQVDRLAENIFRQLIDNKKLFFFLTEASGSYFLPSRITVKGNNLLVRDDNSSIQKSLFDPVYEEEFNETEKSVAIYLDKQEKLLWWYRNRARQDYHIQGWRKNKIYPDFIAADKQSHQQDEYDKVFVLETKGNHLIGNDDTRYKQNVFELCNELGAKKNWKELSNEFPDHNFEFQIVFQDEWQNQINDLFK